MTNCNHKTRLVCCAVSVLAFGCLAGGKVPTVMNIVNFVRGSEPRFPDIDLVLPLREEIRLNTSKHLPNTIVTYYIDGVSQGWQRASGMMPDMPASVLEIGTRANVLQIDELRFSNGALDTSDFLKPRPSAGLRLLVR